MRGEYPDGSISHFEGERGKERLVRARFDEGVFHYEGEKGKERQVRQAIISGSLSGIVCHYEGERGIERLVRQDDRDGSILHFEGERDNERLVVRDGTEVCTGKHKSMLGQEFHSGATIEQPISGRPYAQAGGTVLGEFTPECMSELSRILHVSGAHDSHD